MAGNAMAGKKGLDGIDKALNLFPGSSHKVVARLLARAAEREAKQASRATKSTMRQLAGTLAGKGPRGRSGLAVELAKAVMGRGGTTGRASIRQRAPDTGGRPFHFAHSVVNKGDSARAASGSEGARAGGAGGTAGRTGRAATTRSAAHMRYIEREMAVERTYEAGVGRDVGRERQDRSRDGGREAEDDGPEVGQAHATSAAAGQGYVENPTKLGNGETSLASFGTIGETFVERVRFWEALEEAEAHPGARVQHRLIMELPHEAAPEARHEIMRRFCKRFEDDGIPYWVALHAPGAKNDDRNFHAHVVYSERPAKKIEDPATAGATVWDFEVVSSWKSSSRNMRTSRPHRQDKMRAYNGREFIKSRRVEFATITNEVMAATGGASKGKGGVRYDARSYKAMGVDVIPMRSINRIVADKVKVGQVSILDADYTRRMIATEMRDAAGRRQTDVVDLIALDDAIQRLVEGRVAGGRPGRLPADLRPSPTSVASRPMMKSLGDRLLAARHEALQVDVMERATLSTLERIVEATGRAPPEKIVSSRGRGAGDDGGAARPAPDAMALLRAAALDEIAETRRAAKEARRATAYKVGRAADAWRALVGAVTPGLDAPTRPRPPWIERDGDVRGSKKRPDVQMGKYLSSMTEFGLAGVAGREKARAPQVQVSDRGKIVQNGMSGFDESRTVPAGRDGGTDATVSKKAEGRTSAGGADPGGVAPTARKADGGQTGDVGGAGERTANMRAGPMQDHRAYAETNRAPPNGGLTAEALIEASRSVSRMIGAIRDTVAKPEDRMQAVEKLLEDLAREVTSKKRAVREMEARMAAPSAKDGLTDIEASRAGAVGTPETSEVETAGPSRTTDAAVAASVTPEHPPKAEALAEGSTSIQAGPGDGDLPEAGAGPPGRSAESEVIEDPDAARRRRLREEMIEERKRKRKAVLGRRNRDRGR